MEWKVEKVLADLFEQWYGSKPDLVIPMPPSGSNRQYFRLKSGNDSAVAAFNPDTRENRAFLELTGHFLKLGLPVPEILAKDPDGHCYLQTDLGNTTLFSLLPHDQPVNAFDDQLMALYKQVLDLLPLFQVDAAQLIDFNICTPRHAFDRHSMMWDLNYFKYYFLKISGIRFDEQLLEDDFEKFTAHLAGIPASYFMYRDFQSRNIMLHKGKPFFIDYQGGRKGPLAYDIASLLFDAKANIPFHQREELLDHYTSIIEEKITAAKMNAFRESFYDFVLIRILQALGSYGFRGGVEKKQLFLQSVPYALKNLAWLQDNGHLPGCVPYLRKLTERIIREKPVLGNMETAIDILPPPDDELTIRICSFSYRKGIPADNSGNGGGFVFDCRALPNPGREERYKSLTGKDHEVIRFLRSDKDVSRFLQNAREMVEPAVKSYLNRGFTSLAVCFGCTGGQHRSVFCAETLAADIRKTHNVNVILQHFEESNWP